MPSKADIAAKNAPRRGLREPEAGLYIGISATKFRQLVDAGRIPRPKRLDGCLIYDIRVLDDFLDNLPLDEPDGGERDTWAGVG